MDRPLDEQTRRRQRRARAAWVAGGGLALVTVLTWLPGLVRPSRFSIAFADAGVSAPTAR